LKKPGPKPKPASSSDGGGRDRGHDVDKKSNVDKVSTKRLVQNKTLHLRSQLTVCSPATSPPAVQAPGKRVRGAARSHPDTRPADYRPRKPVYQNQCRREYSNLHCDKFRCEALHEEQREYFVSPQYAEDGRPWQHKDPMIFDLANLPWAVHQKCREKGGFMPGPK